MKQLASDYTFNATAKTVTLNGLNISLAQILLVTAKGKILYSLADGIGAAGFIQSSDSVLTLQSTSGLTNSDKLTIFYEDGLKGKSDGISNHHRTFDLLNDYISVSGTFGGYGMDLLNSNTSRQFLHLRSNQNNVKLIFGETKSSILSSKGKDFFNFCNNNGYILDTANKMYTFDSSCITTTNVFAWTPTASTYNVTDILAIEGLEKNSLTTFTSPPTFTVFLTATPSLTGILDPASNFSGFLGLSGGTNNFINSTHVNAGVSVNSLAITNDNKILVGGQFTSYKEVSGNNHIIKLNLDGTKDTSFDNSVGFNSFVNCLAIQPDGKIFVGGQFTSYKDATNVRYFVKLNADGTRDTSFDSLMGFNVFVNCVALQSDGKVIVGGHFSSYKGVSTRRLVRLNANGTLDYSFNFNSSATPACLAIQTDGKILVGVYGFPSVFYRLNPDGTEDTSFDMHIGVGSSTTGQGSVRCIDIQSDGKIIIGGDFITYKNVITWGIVRLNSDGTIDETFMRNPFAFSQGVYLGSYSGGITDIKILPNGNIFVSGFTNDLLSGILKTPLNTFFSAILAKNGTVISSFKTKTLTTSSGFFASSKSWTGGRTSVFLNNKLYVGGDMVGYGDDFGFIPLPSTYVALPNGLPDLSFDTTLALSSTNSYTHAVQTDGKIIVAGSFTKYGSVDAQNITRLNANGTTDLSFNTASGFNNVVTETAIQSDGKILVGGYFTTYKGVSANNIARLNSDGTRDASFDAGVGFSSTWYVNEFALQSDGKILAVGGFSTYRGTNAVGVVRINPDGTRDSSFDTTTGISGGSAAAHCLAVQSDGKIIVGGSFTHYKSVAAGNMVRLNTDGTRDTSFNIGTGANGSVNCTILQTDGKIIVAGSFTSYNGNGARRIMRLNTDGTIDTSFNTVTGFEGASGNVTSIAIQSDGKILVIGSFTSYKSVPAYCIIRLNTDGTVDYTYDFFTNGSNVVSSMVSNKISVLSNGNAIISTATSVPPYYLGSNYTNVGPLMCFDMSLNQ